MPPRTSPSTAPTDSDSARLLDAVVYLSQQAGILIDLIDDVREDLSWLTRNGVPHQPLIVRVERMARDPLASDWGERLKVSILDVAPQLEAESRGRSNPHIDSLIEALADPLGQAAPEKLATLISLFDHVKHEVLKAIRSPSGETSTSPEHATPCETKEQPATARPGSRERRSAPPGHLF